MCQRNMPTNQDATEPAERPPRSAERTLASDRSESESLTKSSVDRQNAAGPAVTIGESRDVEKGIQSNEAGDGGRDPNLVMWSGPDDPENPKNWSMGKKWAATLVVSFTFISPVSLLMVALALAAMS
ncbi:hypothetical protein F4819DRAFT_143512 [Hypoxylon fuscum]|nr:hypothetical protein F4819DRAFT_143512 [Hypoxylon fuscum]